MGSMHNNERLLVDIGNVEAAVIRASASGGGGGGTGESTSLVYRPGGAPAPGVFTTSAALKAALLTIDPEADKIITIGGQAATFNAADSPWPLGNTTIEAGEGLAVVTFEAGLTMAPTVSVLRLRNVALVIDPASVAPMWTIPTVVAALDLNTSQISNTGTQSFVNLPAGLDLVFTLDQGSVLANGPIVEIQSGATVGCTALGGSTIGAGTFVHGAVANGTLNLNVDPASAQLVATQTDAANLTVTKTIFDTAANTTQTSGAVDSPGNSVNVVTGNISQTRSGSKMLVMGTIAGVTAGATTVTLQLKRDGATGTSIGNPIVATTLSAGDGFEGAINFIDTPPDTATHTYALVATAGAGNITCAANSIQVAVAEIS